MIRVIAGVYKGRKLKYRKDPEIRPTSQLVKESLFNILGYKRIIKTNFLDGFCGTGAVGIEALSRGADFVVFIDNNEKALKLVRENLEVCEIKDGFEIIKNDFNRGVIELAKKGILFDIVFIDPPYELLNLSDPLKVLWKRRILKKDGIAVVQHSAKINYSQKYFQIIKRKNYGDTALSFFIQKEMAPSLSNNSGQL
ncbi:MAG: 16S rRNA (guanine(966)-N(2))-methyltransferase RsmD [Candidatus Aminicenantia bacterium]